jgi:hypothetical protein
MRKTIPEVRADSPARTIRIGESVRDVVGRRDKRHVLVQHMQTKIVSMYDHMTVSQRALLDVASIAGPRYLRISLVFMPAGSARGYTHIRAHALHTPAWPRAAPSLPRAHDVAIPYRALCGRRFSFELLRLLLVPDDAAAAAKGSQRLSLSELHAVLGELSTLKVGSRVRHRPTGRLPMHASQRSARRCSKRWMLARPSQRRRTQTALRRR